MVWCGEDELGRADKSCGLAVAEEDEILVGGGRSEIVDGDSAVGELGLVRRRFDDEAALAEGEEVGGVGRREEARVGGLDDVGVPLYR